MDFIIPYTKEIDFESKIKEITSISLEHEYTFNDSEIQGNFIVSGEYKSHELSINKEEFNYTLPFNISISDELNKDTIKFEITDFSYDILNNNILKVMIESKVSGDVVIAKEQSKEELFEQVSDIPQDLEINERKDIEEENEVKIINEETKIIKEENYSTYLIHVISAEDTIESICQKHKITKSDLEEYNDLTKISIGEKLLIPTNEQ